MTEDRKKLIARFQTWLDTNPRKELIASECANIAEQYHTEQSKLFGVGIELPTKDSQGFKDWLKKLDIKRFRDTDFYEWNNFKYTRRFFFEKYTEDKNKR